MWTIRCRAPSGQATISGIDPDQTVISFLQTLSGHTGIASDKQQLLSGFPPRPMQIPNEQATVRSLGLANGDAIVVKESDSIIGSGAVESAAAPLAPAAPASGTSSAAPAPAAATPAPAPAAPKPAAVAAPAAPRPPASTAAAAAQLPQLDQSAAAAAALADEDAELAAAIAMSLADAPPGTQQAGASAARLQTPAAAAACNSSSPVRSHPTRPMRTAASHASSQTPAGNVGAATSIPLPDGSCVVRRVIASDNSCLFNAVGYVMERSRAKALELRAVIATAVASDPETYSEAFLGKPNQEYCRWIQQQDKWGGAIELSILCRHFGRELAAYDIQTKRCDVYGQGSGYRERSMLIYDGLHYDAMAVSAFEGAPEELDVTIFSTSSRDAADISSGAERLVAAAHAARQFTDTANFTLRCGVCQIGLRGEQEAVVHAKSTGHTNFSEY